MAYVKKNNQTPISTVSSVKKPGRPPSNTNPTSFVKPSIPPSATTNSITTKINQATEKKEKEIIKNMSKSTPNPQSQVIQSSNDNSDDYSADLMKQINREAGEQVAFNLGMKDAPTYVKRWISTGSKLLDYVISNRRDGGLPEGRIVELQGPTSAGKSHVMFEIAKTVQSMGGVVAYFDTENATSPENLQLLGINVSKNFLFFQTNCTEDVLTYAESIILKTRNMVKEVPVVIIWDSVAACSPKAELIGDYDANSIGLQARVLSKGMRKISNVIANQKVLFLIVNQQRMKIGCVGINTPIIFRKKEENNGSE